MKTFAPSRLCGESVLAWLSPDVNELPQASYNDLTLLLNLELTESLLLDNVNDTIDKMNAINRMGIHFSLDDFGTGYSSLSYLKHLPLSWLKIDQSFVREMMEDEEDDAIVRTIIALGKSLGLRVIAEGVETSEQHQHLIELGCDEFQGYYFGRPQAL